MPENAEACILHVQRALQAIEGQASTVAENERRWVGHRRLGGAAEVVSLPDSHVLMGDDFHGSSTMPHASQCHLEGNLSGSFRCNLRRESSATSHTRVASSLKTNR